MSWPGGERRQASVAAGVAGASRDAPDDRVLLVHDGARPLVSVRDHRRGRRRHADHGAAIPVIPVAETLKRLDGDVIGGDRRPDRPRRRPDPAGRHGAASFGPPIARFPPDAPETWTDEASLLEACTIPVHAVLGDPDNLKVTLPADLARASSMLAGRRPGRHGHRPRLAPVRPGLGLALGGIVIAGAPRLYGHSDGDVALHAICDALLGAAGLGDLGRLFPAGPETPRDIASTTLLAEVRRRVEAAGWQVDRRRRDDRRRPTPARVAPRRDARRDGRRSSAWPRRRST